MKQRIKSKRRGEERRGLVTFASGSRVAPFMLEVHQAHLEKTVRSLFEWHPILVNARKDVQVKNPSTGHGAEVDIWIPNLNLCFEYQDEHHYTSVWYCQEPLNLVQTRDAIKSEIVHTRNETLVAVPCWWDGTEESLVSLIHFQRPDLLSERFDSFVSFSEDSKMISLNPVADVVLLEGVPDVGELMYASFPTALQTAFSLSHNDPWWLGEKYDGIRCCWNPIKKRIYGRSGLELKLPHMYYPHFALPIFCDGEIWYGRGQFADSKKLVISTLPEFNEKWVFLRVINFDAPSSQKNIFEDRYRQLLAHLNIEHPFTEIAVRKLCTNQVMLDGELQQIIKEGGEGIIVRKPNSLYDNGRSTSLYKIKAYRGDDEGLVTKVLPNHICLQLPDGEICRVPKQNSLVEPSELQVGHVVTFAYESWTHKTLPTNPKIFRIRHDVEWETVVENFERKTAQEQHLNEVSQKIFRSSTKPYNFWKAGKLRNMREFFENIFKKRNLDPNVAANWYSLSLKQVKNYQGGASLLEYFKGSLAKAAIHLFPNIGLDPGKFSSVPTNYYADVRNRKRFLHNYAKKNGFDPLVPENWYNVSRADVVATKGGSALLRYYSGSIIRALKHLFSDIGLEDSKFISRPQGYWSSAENRRRVFLEFAQSRNFDPSSPKHWRSVKSDTFAKFPNGAAVLFQYKGSFTKALLSLFPNIGLERSDFSSAKNYWGDIKNQRNVLENFMKAKGLDPLNPENWYSVSAQSVEKSANALLTYYNQSLIDALLNIFPDIGLVEDNFSFQKKNHWAQEDNRKSFFIKLANNIGADPLVPHTWYSMSRADIVMHKGAWSVLHYYEGSYVKAIMALFPNIGLDHSKFFHSPKT